MNLQQYLDKVHALTGEKLKMGNVVTRASYENASVYVGHWLTFDEFEAFIYEVD